MPHAAAVNNGMKDSLQCFEPKAETDMKLRYFHLNSKYFS